MKSFKPALAPRSHFKYLVSLDGTGSKTYIREDGRGQAPIRMWLGEIPSQTNFVHDLFPQILTVRLCSSEDSFN